MKINRKTEPSLVDMKNLVGQMKGLVTWMAKERAELQTMSTQLSDLLVRFAPAATDAPEKQYEREGHREDHQQGNHEEAQQAEGHGDPVISGATEDP